LSSRKKIRRKRPLEQPLLDELFGARAARRVRLLATAAIAFLVFGGCALFLFESQTIGRILLVLGLAWALFRVALRHLARDGDVFGAVHRRRWLFVSASAVLVGAGWIVFFAAWEELGLLLVLFGSLPLLALIATVRRVPLLSPMDGPPFGETGET
jgi:hypothetical protein